MPEISEVCEFVTSVDQVQFETSTNGGKISIVKICLNRDQATSLSWLVNSNKDLEIRIKIKT